MDQTIHFTTRASKTASLPTVLAAILLLGTGCVPVRAAPIQPVVPAALDACAAEVAAAWKNARNTTEAGCNWAAVVTIADARLVQAAALARHFSDRRLIGYKMTFTTDGHTIGEFRDAMLVPSGTSISKAGAWRRLPEADMLLRVKDERINEAKSVQEALQFIDAIVPFVEVSNIIVREGAGRTTVNWTATNASTLSGAYGEPVPVNLAQPDWLQKFEGMRVTLSDPSGAIVREAKVTADFLPGLLILRDEVLARGQRLKAGHLLSLGTFGRPVVGMVAPGPYQVTYHGLTDQPATATAVIVP
jgi:2-keto-4-pentenoate hydratase